MEAISAMESTTVNIVTHTPKKTQILPAGPPFASEEAPVLYSALASDHEFQFSGTTAGRTYIMASGHVMDTITA
jgi:hypothetical protein